MTMKLNRHGYEQLVEGDLDWLRQQPKTLESKHIAEVLTWSIDALYPAKHWQDAVRALINSLPKCDECAKPATRALERGDRYCDKHGNDVAEYPRAAPLRALIKLLEGE